MSAVHPAPSAWRRQKMAGRGSRKDILAVAMLCLALASLAGDASSNGPSSSQPIIIGRVFLQGRANHAGATVRLGSLTATTAHDGTFILANAPLGVYTAEAISPGFLAAERQDVQIAAGQIVTLPDITLAGGDMDQDGDIDLFDLVVLGAAYGQSVPSDPFLDLNADSYVNLLDLVILGSNYGRTGPIAWEGQSVPTPTATACPTGTSTATATPLPTSTPTVTPTAMPASTPTPTLDPVAVAAWVSDPDPVQFSTVTVYGRLTFRGAPVSSVAMKATWHFDNGLKYCTARTGIEGIASCSRFIWGATQGYYVSIDLEMSFAGRIYYASTGFTPR